MRKDFKTGMIIGVVLVIVATLMFSVWPEGSIESRQRKNFLENGGIAKSSDLLEPDNDQSSDEPESNDPQPEELDREGLYHLVGAGETLSDLAEKYLGDPMMTNGIVDANPEVIADADVIKPGMRLFIPIKKNTQE